MYLGSCGKSINIGAWIPLILSAGIIVTIDAESHVIKVHDCKFIPQGAFHSVAPLDGDTMLLAVLFPPEEGIPPSEE